MPSIQATGATLAKLWPAMTTQDEVDGYAYSLLNKFGQRLSVDRQNQAWLLHKDNWVCADCDFYNNIGITTQSQIGNPMWYLTGTCTDPSAQFRNNQPSNTKYPCLIGMPGSVDNGIQNNQAIPFRFKMAGGPNGIVEYYYRLDGQANYVSPHSSLPAMPKWLEVITTNYEPNATATADSYNIIMSQT